MTERVPRPAERRIANARRAWHELEVCLRSFVLAYEEQNDKQMLAVYHDATKALTAHDAAQGAIAAALQGE